MGALDAASKSGEDPHAQRMASSAHEMLGVSQSEREESLWCEVVRLRYRLRQIEQDNGLLRELIDLMKQQRGAEAPHAVAAPDLPDRHVIRGRPRQRLNLQERQQIIDLLKAGNTIHRTALLTGRALSTVTLIKKQSKVVRDISWR